MSGSSSRKNKENSGFHHPDKTELLSRTTPFQLLDQKDLEFLAEKCRIKKYQSGTYIFRKGENSHRILYLVVQGKVEITVEEGYDRNDYREERVPGEFFGETVMFSTDVYPAYSSAAEETTCLLVPAEAFEQLLSSNPEMATYFSNILTNRMKAYYSQLDERKHKSFFQDDLLQKRVSEIMVSPLVTCLPDQEVRDAALQMSQDGVGSLIVTDGNGKIAGIVTQKDLMNKVLARKEDQKPHYVYQIMSEKVISVNISDFVYQALLLMIKHHVKRIVVIEDEGQPVGLITVNDLIKTRGWGTFSVVKSIETFKSIEGLSEVIKEVDQVQQALLVERASAQEICEIITEIYDRIICRILEITEEEMLLEGWGRPPVKYCWINMGSGGRREQFARTDQDNGIIFEDLPTIEAEQEASKFFLELGRKAVKGLEKCGFKRCPGGVMAENPRLCRSLASWIESVEDWMTTLDPVHIRNMSIFLDFRPVYGEKELAHSLRREVSKMFKGARTVLSFLAEDNLNYRVPLNIIRQFITDKSGRIDLKKSASAYLIEGIRIYSLREGIMETSTFRRIRGLEQRNVFKRDFIESMEEAFETLLKFRISRTLQNLKRGEEPDNYIRPADLGHQERIWLKEAFLTINKLQKLTSQSFLLGKI